MFKWLREYYEIKDAFKQPKHCESCDTLKMQLSIANDNNKQLLDRLLTKPVEIQSVSDSELKPVQPNRHLNWRTRQQMLEAEDREQARLLKQSVERSTNKISTEDLEKELKIVETEREA